MAYTDLLQNYIDHKKHPLKYIPDEKTFNIINESLYGGNCQVFERYGKTEKEDELIFSIDENNLYGHSMSQLLPYGDFKYSADKRCKQICKTFNTVSKDSKLHQNYSHKALHPVNSERISQTNKVPADPYNFNGFMRVHLSYSPQQKERVKLFPPLNM
jgi:hypothetical protein